MTNHHNRAPFPYRVERDGAGRPFAAFSNEETANDYAKWFSRFGRNKFRLMITYGGNVIAYYFEGVRYES